MKNTTNTSGITEQNAKLKEIPSVAELDMRDYFAAHAINAAVLKAIHNFTCDGVDDTTIDWDHIAWSAYDAADAMLEAREK